MLKFCFLESERINVAYSETNTEEVGQQFAKVHGANYLRLGNNETVEQDGSP